MKPARPFLKYIFNGNVSETLILVEQRTFDKTKNYLWPIPQSQLDIDKNLSQNPNY
ncbi:MAG: RagB/SusD family nutrient uptake outer membrane protein [Chitinophagales bacterium]